MLHAVPFLLSTFRPILCGDTLWPIIDHVCLLGKTQCPLQSGEDSNPARLTCALCHP